MAKETRIHKLRQETHFTQVPNAVLRDKRISLKTKGMLSLLLSYPDNWEIHKSKIIETVKESRTAVDNCFNELVELGYMKKDRKRNADGTFSYTYYVSATPIFTTARKPTTDNPTTDNMHLQINREQTKNQQTKTELDILVDADFDFLVSVMETVGVIHPHQITPQQQKQLLDSNKYATDSSGNIVTLPF